MNIDFKTVIFPTYEQGAEQTQKKRTINTLQTILILIIAIALTFILGNVSIYLGLFVPFLLVILLKVFISQKGRTELKNFKKNGTLSINNEGILIDQSEKVSIPYDTVRKINFEFDRADPLHIGKFPKARTFKLIIQTDRSIKTIYVDKDAELGYRKLYGDLIETLQALRRTNHELYKKIQSNA